MSEPENGGSEETTWWDKLLTAAELVKCASDIVEFVKWMINLVS